MRRDPAQRCLKTRILRLSPGFALALCGACSNVAKAPSYRACERDEDCYPHERCSIQDQGRCVSAQVPRRSSFAFAGTITQGQAPGSYEIPWEFKGCELDAFDPDTGVARIDLNRKLLPIRLEQLSFNTPVEGLCAASCAPHAYCDAAKGQCAFARHGRWQLRRASRLGLEPLALTLDRVHETPDPGAAAPSFEFRWPCAPAPTWVQETNQGLGFELGTPELSPSDRSVTLPAITCASARARSAPVLPFDLSQQQQDSRSIEVVPIDGASDKSFNLSLAWHQSSSPLLASTAGQSIAARTISCTQDQDCSPSPRFPAYCDSRGRCRLDLTEQRAATLTNLSSHPQRALIHLDPGQPERSALLAKVQGGPDAKIANMTIPVKLDEASPLRLCLPKWTTPSDGGTLALHDRASPIDWTSYSPRALLGEKKACRAEDLSKPEAPEQCRTDLRPSLTLHASLNEKGRAHFESNGCPLPQDESLTLSLPLSCDGQGHCESQARQSPLAGPCYDLDLRLQRPAGELFRSLHQRFSQALCPDQPISALEIEDPWAPRPLLRGRVYGAQDPNAALRVRVMAERLQDGSTDALGPFFFHQDVVPEGPRRGEFALPVEPGRYVITAVAHDPIQQGLSSYRILDLRDSAPSVDDPRTQLELLPGPLVQIQVNPPPESQRVKARPIDTGSWVEDPMMPDLNDPQTCFPSDRGCLIRSLTIPIGRRGQEIPVDYRSVLRWATRPGGHLECPASAKARKEPA